MTAITLVGLSCASSNDKSTDYSTGSGGSGATACTTDSQCGLGGACIVGICVLPPGPLTGVAIEVSPPATKTSTAGLTEFLNMNVSDPLMLKLDSVESVELRLTGSATAPVPAPARVVYTQPSSIFGQPTLVFETELTSDTVKLSLPAGVAAKAGLVRVLPQPNADSTSPPFSIPLPAETTVMRFTIPDGLLAIRGVLRDASGGPPAFTFVARAYQDGTLISNRPAGGADGSFVLIIPAAAASRPVTIEILPQQALHPSFKFEPITPGQLTQTQNLDLGVVTLAAYHRPNAGEVIEAKVHGGEVERRPVIDAFVRATTILEQTNQGATRFQVDSSTDDQGIARFALLPGTAQQSRYYDFRVIPGAGSIYRNECRPAVPVAGSTGTLVEVELRHRQLHTGRILSAARVPVPGVMVNATQLAGGADDCRSPFQTITSATTGPDGAFAMRLDPGSYQFDYEPRSGSPLPRRTEFVVDIEESSDADVDDERDEILLRAGVLAQGDVVDNEGLPVANAIVRIFQPRCTKAEGCVSPPYLLAEVQTDAAGHFRAVMSAVP